MFGVVRRNLINHVTSKNSCSGQNYSINNLPDTNYDGTPLKKWINDIPEVEYCGGNSKILHGIRKQSLDKN